MAAGNREAGNFVNRAVGLISRGGGYLACDLSHDTHVTYPPVDRMTDGQTLVITILRLRVVRNKSESINIKGRR